MDAQLVKEGVLPPLGTETANPPAPPGVAPSPRGVLPGVIRARRSAPLVHGDYTYTTNAAGEATITGFNKSYTGALTITNTLGGCRVTIIGNGALRPQPDRVEGTGFSGCTGLTSVTIPASVTSIGRYAFAGCSRLANVMLGTGLTSLGTGRLTATPT